jgi:hypothetical protein
MFLFYEVNKSYKQGITISLKEEASTCFYLLLKFSVLCILTKAGKCGYEKNKFIIHNS